MFHLISQERRTQKKKKKNQNLRSNLALLLERKQCNWVRENSPMSFEKYCDKQKTGIPKIYTAIIKTGGSNVFSSSLLCFGFFVVLGFFLNMV